MLSVVPCPSTRSFLPTAWKCSPVIRAPLGIMWKQPSVVKSTKNMGIFSRKEKWIKVTSGIMQSDVEWLKGSDGFFLWAAIKTPSSCRFLIYWLLHKNPKIVEEIWLHIPSCSCKDPTIKPLKVPSLSVNPNWYSSCFLRTIFWKKKSCLGNLLVFHMHEWVLFLLASVRTSGQILAWGNCSEPSSLLWRSAMTRGLPRD